MQLIFLIYLFSIKEVDDESLLQPQESQVGGSGRDKREAACVYSCSNPNFTPSGSSCFYWSSDLLNQSDAVVACAAMSANLATIEDSQQEDLITSFGDDQTVTWIGLNDFAQEGTFVWQDNSPLTYSNWWTEPGEVQPDGRPGECCVGKMKRNSRGGKWYDLGWWEKYFCVRMGRKK